MMHVDLQKINNFLFYSIKNYGAIRIFKRILFFIRRNINNRLTLINTIIFSFSSPKIKISSTSIIQNYQLNIEESCDLKSIEFTFLNEKKLLKVPFKWNCKKWSRLWQFNLHYFDWAKSWLEEYIKHSRPNKYFKFIGYLLDDWINNNKIGTGDGWHSYTISIRLRNWIWLFIFIPSLITKKRKDSLWRQFIWLRYHLEDDIGGNHLLENLTALIIGGIFFDSNKADKIFSYSIVKLKKELDIQILKDGGHFERSASYHILILERLIEVIFLIRLIKKEKNEWLINKITKMSNWLEVIRLENGSFPNFNDSCKDACNNIDIILELVDYYNSDNFKDNEALELLFLKRYNNNKKNKELKNNIVNQQSKIKDLPDTGWTFLRPGNGWELIFKNGIPCPKFLPAHAHSDLLSFNLYKEGEPIFIEAGTSIYGNKMQRFYERSGAAHNIFQIASSSKEIEEESSSWIEPVEIIGNFYAARQAYPIFRDCGKTEDENLFVKGEHDGYKHLRVHHRREINLKLISTCKLNLKLIDYIKTPREYTWRNFFHFSPDLTEKEIKSITNQIVHTKKLKFKLIDTTYSLGFGKTVFRKSLYLTGRIYPGKNIVEYNICIEK